MKRVTITYTRQNEETPWYWQITPNSVFSSMDAFLDENATRMEESAYTIGNQCIVVFTFNDEEIYQEFQTLIINDIKSDYKQYCDDNNITIDAVTEDI
jgi:hypothetical protein